MTVKLKHQKACDNVCFVFKPLATLPSGVYPEIKLIVKHRCVRSVTIYFNSVAISLAFNLM